MKLLYKNIDKKNSGTICLVAEEPEDMWHAYNLICIGDSLKSTTIRRVVNESAGGLTSTSRVHTTLRILVKSLDFDTQAGVLRVKGTNIEENAYVKMGAYHTIDLELNRKFDITKTEWDSVALDRINEACDPAQNADMAAVVMQEGLAHVCLILSSMTIVKSKIELAIPRKRKNMCANHDKSLERFFELIIKAILTHINFNVVKACIIASPGFLKDQFLGFMNDYAVKNISTHKVLIDNKSKFVLVHSASGFKHSLKEIFEDPNLLPKLSDTKALGEIKALEQFYLMLKTEPERAFYGYKHCEKANEADAIDVLLISDSLFRSKELSERKRYVSMVDKVRENNGQVKIFSSLHVSGEQLMQLTGIAAILRFPMPDIEDELLSESDDDMAFEIKNKPNDVANQNDDNDNADECVVTSKNEKSTISTTTTTSATNNVALTNGSNEKEKEREEKKLNENASTAIVTTSTTIASSIATSTKSKTTPMPMTTANTKKQTVVKKTVTSKKTNLNYDDHHLDDDHDDDYYNDHHDDDDGDDYYDDYNYSSKSRGTGKASNKYYDDDDFI